MPPRFTAALAIVVLLSGCAPAAPAALPAPTAPPATATPLPSPTPLAPQVQPPAPGQETVRGVIQAFADGRVTLQDGKSFTLPSDVRLLRSEPKKPSDLKAGQYVAITAKLGAGGVLNASSVGIFGAGFGQVGAGQRPLPSGDLMTNATIQSVDGVNFTAAYPGGDAKVRLLPDAQVLERSFVSASDIRPGMQVAANVAGGVATAFAFQ